MSAKLMEVEFRNVTVIVSNATDAREAYARVCNALDAAGLEWDTDTYVTYGRQRLSPESEERPTMELWPVD